MKIVHTADLHLDSPLTSHLSPSKIASRKRELLSTFRSVVEGAKLRGAEAIIIAGDLFDSRTISQHAMTSVVAEIRSHPDLFFFYLPGNHEKNSFAAEAGAMSNLRVFGEDWTRFDYKDVTLVGRSSTAADMFSSLTLAPDRKNIVVLHGSVKDRSDAEDGIGLMDAAGKYIDYLALGHYHSYTQMRIDDRGIAAYCGTPEGRGFDETGTKGYLLLDTERLRDVRFVPCGRRTLHHVDVDVTDALTQRQTEDRVEAAIATIGATDLVRVTLSGRAALGTYRDVTALQQRFEDRFYYFEVRDESRTEIRAEDYRYDRSLKGEFIRSVSAADLPEKDKADIIACGLCALQGEVWSI